MSSGGKNLFSLATETVTLKGYRIGKLEIQLKQKKISKRSLRRGQDNDGDYNT